MMHGMWHDGGWGWGAWIAMALMMVAFWGLVAALVVYAVRSFSRPATGSATGGAPDDPLRILDGRFARGEIDVDEYTRRREVLGGR